MSKLTTYDVANVLLRLSDTDSGDVVTNLKMQKLIYYTQGFHLAINDTPLFDEDLVAWEHGPVSVSLYEKLRSFKSGQIEISEPVSVDITAEQLDLINEVLNVYGQFSAWKLRDMTHNETPWTSTLRGEKIDKTKLTAYFKTQLQ